MPIQILPLAGADQPSLSRRTAPIRMAAGAGPPWLSVPGPSNREYRARWTRWCPTPTSPLIRRSYNAAR